MPKIQKGNRIIEVSVSQLDGYLKRGYDQVDEETGDVIKLATGGKQVPLAEFNALKAELEAIKNGVVNDGNSAEINSLKAQLSEKDDEIKALEAENIRLSNDLRSAKGQLKATQK